MCSFMGIMDIYAREILDSQGTFTIEVEVLTEDGSVGKSAVPSLSYTGGCEEARQHKQDILFINSVLADLLIGENVYDQLYLDRLLRDEAGCGSRKGSGGYHVLGVSMAAADAAAKSLGLPLYRYLGGNFARRLPVPMVKLLGSGGIPGISSDFRDLMVMPAGAENYSDGLTICCEIYHALGKILPARGHSLLTDREGAFVPGKDGGQEFLNTSESLRLICEAIEQAGHVPGKDAVIALDAGADVRYDEGRSAYRFPGAGGDHGGEVWRNGDEMVRYYEGLCRDYPVVSIEGGLAVKDKSSLQKLVGQMGGRLQIIGCSPDSLLRESLSGNTFLIRTDGAGTLTDLFERISQAHQRGYRVVISQSDGETEDAMPADLAVAAGAEQIKAGAPCGGERTAKYNRLLRIEDSLGRNAQYGAEVAWSRS